MRRADSLYKFGVCYDVFANHWPQVSTSYYRGKCLKPAFVVLVVIFSKRNLGTLHLFFFLGKSFYYVPMFARCHR